MQDTILVMVKTIIKSLFTRSACKMYPAREPVLFKRTRGRIEMDPALCIACTLCAKRCPTGAIVVDREKRTWEIDRFKCILCGNCTEGCRPKALRMDIHYTGPVVTKRTEISIVNPATAKDSKADLPSD